MPRIRKIIPGVDPKLLIKDAAKLMPDPTRRLFLRGGASLGALAFLTGCDIIDGAVGRAGADEDFLPQRSRAGAGCSIRTSSRPTYPESAITRPFPLQRLLSGGRSARGRQGRLQARGRRPGRQQEALDARRALRAAAGNPDHPPRLRRGLERDRQMDRRAAARIPQARRRRHRAPNMSGSAAPRAIPHSIDMPTALHPQTQMTFKFDDQILPRKYGFPMKVPHPDQARLQEPEVRDGDGRHQQLNPAATGKTRATTGSAEVEQTCAAPRFETLRRRRFLETRIEPWPHAPPGTSVISRAPRWNVM